MVPLTRREFVGGAIALALSAGRTGGVAAKPVETEIVVRPNVRRQVIEGFGASGAWWAQEIGGWDEPNRQRIIELLFNRERGIGLSRYRYNIGAGDGKEIPDP